MHKSKKLISQTHTYTKARLQLRNALRNTAQSPLHIHEFQRMNELIHHSSLAGVIPSGTSCPDFGPRCQTLVTIRTYQSRDVIGSFCIFAGGMFPRSAMRCSTLRPTVPSYRTLKSYPHYLRLKLGYIFRRSRYLPTASVLSLADWLNWLVLTDLQSN